MTRYALIGATLALGLALGLAHAQDSRPTEKKVQVAPDFTLTDLDGKDHKLSDYTKAGKIVVLEWFNPGCPFVVRHHEQKTTMKDTYAKYKDKDVVWIAINSGAPGKQGTGKERNAKAVKNWGIAYPLCLDEDGKVGKLYGATTTPHMFVIGKNGAIVYEGAIDDDKRGKKDSPTNYVDAALAATVAGTKVTDTAARPYGCSVKYAK
jgi:peroxiredoxin